MIIFSNLSGFIYQYVVSKLLEMGVTNYGKINFYTRKLELGNL